MSQTIECQCGRAAAYSAVADVLRVLERGEQFGIGHDIPEKLVERVRAIRSELLIARGADPLKPPRAYGGCTDPATAAQHRKADELERSAASILSEQERLRREVAGTVGLAQGDGGSQRCE
jgi:hypothetical protein